MAMLCYKKETQGETEKDKETEIMWCIPVVVIALCSEALQIHTANLLKWKIKQRRHSVPLKTLRYMAAFVIIMGQVLNWDMFIYQWF